MRHLMSLILMLVLSSPAQARVAGTFGAPEPVTIKAYGGEAMEPFLSRDGRFLFFNTRNDPGVDTDIHFAERIDDTTFAYRGRLNGTKSADLDGVPTMAADGTFCFISPRDYRKTLLSVYCGRFDGTDVQAATAQAGLKTARLGRLIFDVELAADGQTMIFAEGTFSGGAVPDAADLFAARRGPRGFERDAALSRQFAAVNTDALEFAPALSADGLELFFTRLKGFWIFREPKIYRAMRRSVDEPFGPPERLPIDGFVEGPTLSPDGGSLYFHKRVDGRFALFRVRR